MKKNQIYYFQALDYLILKIVKIIKLRQTKAKDNDNNNKTNIKENNISTKQSCFTTNEDIPNDIKLSFNCQSENQVSQENPNI